MYTISFLSLRAPSCN